MKQIIINTKPMASLLTAFLAISAVAGCSEKDLYPDTAKDWEGTSDYFLTDDETQFTTYYKPYVGNVGDPMPFFDPKSGTYRILYLQDFTTNKTGTYHPIWAVETSDGASYTSLGELVPYGSIDEQDAAIGTGCAVYNGDTGLYHIYYTGNKYQPTASENGQVVMRAVSTDFVTWTKDLSFSLKGNDNGYSKSDFRDPCVFQDDAGKWRMVISTKRTSDGKGVLAEYVSDDMNEWTHNGVFMNMIWDRFYECPDVFKMGDWWYLVYSDIAAFDRKVHYMIGKTLDELKSATAGEPLWPDSKEGALDSRAFYAGKTASDGEHRLLWGWCPTRDGEDNTEVSAEAEPNWGGALVCHELVQNAEDGTLRCVAPEAVENKYSETCEVRIMGGTGYTASGGTYSLTGNSHILFSRLSYHNLLKFSVKADAATTAFGISLVRGSDSEKYYSVIFNPEDNGASRKLNFEERGPEGKGFISGIDSSFFPASDDNVYNVTVITDNSVCTVYVNDEIVWTNRIYGISRNCWSVDCLTDGGSIEVSDLQIRKY